jgi:hypothetical protein
MSSIPNKSNNQPKEHTETNLLESLKQLLKTHSLKQLADKLNVATGTITRWIELDHIPKNYEFDILKMGNRKINYANYTTKEKDQFFTPIETAKTCYQYFCDTLCKYGDDPTQYTYIEPSAGDGNFLNVLPSPTIAMDIEPRHSSVIEQDYLDWKPISQGKYAVFGNPPFGLRGHMALSLITWHLYCLNYLKAMEKEYLEKEWKDTISSFQQK